MGSRLQRVSRPRGLNRLSLALAAGAAAALALVPVGAAAQLPMSMAHDKPAPTPEQIEKQRALDKAYKAATQKIPEKNVADPWGNIRPAPGTAAGTKSAKKGKP